MLRSPMRALCSTLALLCLSTLGCTEEVDPRYATPQATVASLFAAYGVEELPEAAAVEQMRAGERFTLRDPVGHADCFADYGGEVDEGAAGYVFGQLVVRKDHLHFERRGADTRVYPSERRGEGAPFVTLREVDGAHRFVLAESVPAEVRERLRLLYQRGRELELRGPPR